MATKDQEQRDVRSVPGKCSQPKLPSVPPCIGWYILDPLPSVPSGGVRLASWRVGDGLNSCLAQLPELASVNNIRAKHVLFYPRVNMERYAEPGSWILTVPSDILASLLSEISGVHDDGWESGCSYKDNHGPKKNGLLSNLLTEP